MGCLKRQLGHQHLTDWTPGRGGEHSPDKRHILITGRIVEHVQRALTVAEPHDPGGVHAVLSRKDQNSRGQFVQVRLHAHHAAQPGKILHGMRPRGPFVIAEGGDTDPGKRLGEEPCAAIGAGQQWRTPVPVRRPATGDEDDRRKRSLSIRPRERALHRHAIQFPRNTDRTHHHPIEYLEPVLRSRMCTLLSLCNPIFSELRDQSVTAAIAAAIRRRFWGTHRQQPGWSSAGRRCP